MQRNTGTNIIQSNCTGGVESSLYPEQLVFETILSIWPENNNFLFNCAVKKRAVELLSLVPRNTKKRGHAF